MAGILFLQIFFMYVLNIRLDNNNKKQDKDSEFHKGVSIQPTRFVKI